MMTEYCMQCGKVLTTGDDRFQCFSCWYKNNRQEDEDSDLQKIRCDEIKATIAQKDAEIERLREIIDDYRESISKVLDDRCPADECHCGCVPILQNEVERLREALNEFLPRERGRAWRPTTFFLYDRITK